ncbi:1,4-dihydroxy-2-naphthoate polyprenyltransferase [Corynebacterium sp. TA-R-1]|uniref:1,4-dihydroxy-2-naphthoate octaprenyltransferase n=1 Tax=Corynebacterium stercoris TaxID=2943490 RepID=A0ABT1G252_9CORY|nr:1,4-dihydroxy-2-naphthoate polyprenyltransferase [Corynebacterium stercoris]MCP1388065.1 1,4-dihydroxy-2-naphthoate polyprenyltransferase [Corynebacterium stercoris]
MVGMTQPQEPTAPRNAATFQDWWQAARPHTWPNAFAPVIAGTGAAAFWGSPHLGKALLALGVAWALIVGVNYANDYSDGIRGTDDDRSGPTRLTASGLARPEDVKLAAFAAFAAAAVFGIILAVMSSWWLIIVGAACILAAWFYTGGTRPYGYSGLGEIAVFVFFGLVAVMGTEFTQSGMVSLEGFLCAVAIGAISASVNLANNIRDIETDAAVGKQTLAVKLGDHSARTLFTVLTLAPFAVSLVLAPGFFPTLIAFAALPFAVASILTVRRGATGRELIPVLGMNGRAMLIWAVLTAAALAWGGFRLGQPVPYAAVPVLPFF